MRTLNLSDGYTVATVTDQVTYNSGEMIRVGVAAIVGGVTTERMSVKNSQVATGSEAHAALGALLDMTGNSSLSAGEVSGALRGQTKRTVTGNTSETSVWGGAYVGALFAVTSTFTYTNTSSIGVAGLVVSQPVVTGGGSLALSNYSGIYVSASSTNTGINKYGIKIDNQSASTNNYSLYTGLGKVRIGDVAAFAGATPSTSRLVLIGVSGQTLLAGTTQVALGVNMVANSSATAYAIGVLAEVGTDNSSFTLGFQSSIYENPITKGASTTVTRLGGLRLTPAADAVSTNQASICDNEAYSGLYFLNSTSARPSLFSGVVQFAAGMRHKVYTTNTSNPPTELELDNGLGTNASLGSGFAALVDDNNANTNVYLVASNGTNWFQVALTKCV